MHFLIYNIIVNFVNKHLYGNTDILIFIQKKKEERKNFSDIQNKVLKRYEFLLLISLKIFRLHQYIL